MTHDEAAERGDTDGGQQLRTLREDMHMTTEELAALAGVSEDELAEMENGRREVPPHLIGELMEELNAKGA
jgi:transcriptional regulator with XRE-family HTH domain